MSPDPSPDTATIGWNGLRLQTPQNWETIVSGPEHLVFEDDFEPILQVRWNNIGPLSDNKWHEKSEQWWKDLDLISREVSLPRELQQLRQTFSHVRYFRGKGAMNSGGICYCNHCHTLLIFQHLSHNAKDQAKTAKALISLSCHGPANTLWRIQDFTLETPSHLSLTDYSFKAGLTRLSFTCRDYVLQFCRLGQASARLKDESLESILLTLSGTRELQVSLSDDTTSCKATRTPGIAKQVLLRMRKEKPFIEAQITNVTTQDRLLASVATSTRPISVSDIDYCYETFKII